MSGPVTTLLMYFTNAAHDPNYPSIDQFTVVPSSLLFPDPSTERNWHEEANREAGIQYRLWANANDVASGAISHAQFVARSEEVSRLQRHFHFKNISDIAREPELADDLKQMRSMPQFSHLRI